MISMVDDVSNWPCDGFWQVFIDKKWLFGKRGNMKMMMHLPNEMQVV